MLKMCYSAFDKRCVFNSAAAIVIFMLMVDKSDNETVSTKVTDGILETLVEDIVFIIRSQPANIHEERALLSQQDIKKQCKEVNQKGCIVILLHLKYPQLNAWTILPILPRLKRDFPSKKWFFFCEEETVVNVYGLSSVLSKFDASEDWFLGRALVDQVPSIIHHFKFHEDVSKFEFPDSEAGWLLSISLLDGLSARLETEDPNINFNIDIKHEVALYIWNDDRGQRLKSLSALCASGASSVNKGVLPENGECVTEHPKEIPQCGDPVPQDNIFFAVKTCEKFHSDRVQVLQQTWGQFAKNIIFYSDVADKRIPTEITGIPNVERGHCGKTLAILKKFDETADRVGYNWLIVADDDTILSVSRLQRFLSCYNAMDQIFLGERYGYGLSKGYGYDYITGGGGMVFSRQVVHDLLDNGCKCPADDSPDDMILGMCAKRYKIPVTHSALFHQAKPFEYAHGFLAHQKPISFHKHSNIDPVQVYKTWFLMDDSKYIVLNKSDTSASKDEL